MSAIDEVLDFVQIICNEYNSKYISLSDVIDAKQQLAQLRAAAAERDAAHVYLDESPVNASDDDTPRELADRIALIVKELLELRAKADVSICAWCGTECKKNSTAIAEHVITCEKRPEHAMLVKFEEALVTIAQQAARIAALEESQFAHEEDCAVLPEDVSVTEYVTVLRRHIAALEAAIDRACEQIENGDIQVTRQVLHEAYIAHTPALEAEQASPERIDRIAQKIHAAWMAYNLENGCASRYAFWGEELMRPWDELSERAKELDRATVRAALEIVQVTP